jgi:FPC/CPF motif-containing protein YcgG
MGSWFIDACHFGSVPIDQNREHPPASPREWSTFASQLEGSSKAPGEDEMRKEVQEKLLSLCFGPKGYVAITAIRSTAHYSNARRLCFVVAAGAIEFRQQLLAEK